MEDITVKYRSLSPETQQEVHDFLDFLLTRKKRNPFNIKSWKRKIMNVSAWPEDDIKQIKNQKIVSWKPQEW